VVNASAEHPVGTVSAEAAYPALPAAPSTQQLEVLLRLASNEQAEGRFGTAITLYRFVLALEPGHLNAAPPLARALFCSEDWSAAWVAFEARFLLFDPPRVTRRGPDGALRPVTRWTEGPPPGRLLVMGEQGLGDTIQFARFLPRLVDAGCRTAAVVDSRLFALLRSLPRPIDLFPRGEGGDVQGIDAWVPLLDLPRLLGIGPERFAEPMPYLRADPDRIARWRERIGTKGLRIGIAWQGNPKAPVDAGRSAPLAAFAPLAAIEGVRLISLQRGPGEEQLADVDFADRIETLGASFDDGPDAFLDTAAILQGLDAVVTVDTALVHLAGALGRPAHLLLQWGWSDWRWAARPSDTPWYPSVRLHRQPRAGDWHRAVLSVCAALTSQRARADPPVPRPAPHGAVSPPTLRVQGDHLLTIDQTRLPFERVELVLRDAPDCVRAIVTMQVRGAPLIGAVAGFGLAFALREAAGDAALDDALERFAATRPTAVNLRWALERVRRRVHALPVGARAAAAWDEARAIADEDVVINASIGAHGVALLRELAARRAADGRPVDAAAPLQVLTHCNAGRLAAVAHGTALAPIYALHAAGVPLHVWVDETRPRNQGASLTAWELADAGVPCTVIADNAGGLLMREGRVDAVIVGCDRVARNGDVANKIGTYLKALAARDAGVPFWVACPTPTVDLALADGAAIPIEHRDPRELTHVTGLHADGTPQEVRLVPEGVAALNPAFDVTPARLVDVLITEHGPCAASEAGLKSLPPFGACGRAAGGQPLQSSPL
jgi:methylthioribose-1-phosphate isomerase